MQYKTSETYQNEIQKVIKLPNDKVKIWNLTENKNWIQVASDQNKLNLNVFIKDWKCTDFCIEFPGLCF